MGDARLLPYAGGEPEHGHLIRSEADFGQRVAVPVDPIAELVVRPRLQVPGLQRYAHFAELILVALEHALEGVVAFAVRILRHRASDLRLCQGTAGRQQADDEVEEPLCFAHRHATVTTFPAVSTPADRTALADSLPGALASTAEPYEGFPARSSASRRQAASGTRDSLLR